MTTYEAIERLHNLQSLEEDNITACIGVWYKGVKDDYDEALDMAIEALSNTPNTFNTLEALGITDKQINMAIGAITHMLTRGYYSEDMENALNAVIRVLTEALSCSEEPNRSEPKTSDSGSNSTDIARNTQNETTNGDLISRSKAIRWVKAECNPYGQPTLDYESGIKVIEHLERMSSAQIDLSGYSDRLYRSAYDKGYARCKDDAIDAIGFTLAYGENDKVDDVVEDLLEQVNRQARMMLEDLPSAQPEQTILDDGTLVVEVDDHKAVKSVLAHSDWGATYLIAQPDRHMRGEKNETN